ncbi:hypothetical protein TKK_0010481 [Trichogramma kaykai]
MSSQLKQPSRLMIDTGAGVSVIKRSFIASWVRINEKERVLLKGITDKLILAPGTITVWINDITPVKMYVVEDDFPIIQEGIVGTRSLKDCKSNINYETDTLILDGQTIPFTIGDPRREIPSKETCKAEKINRETELFNEKEKKLRDDMINELYEIYRARQESNAGVPQEQTKGIEESKKTEDSIEVIENDEMAKFYEKTELEEIKHLICGKISEDYDKKDKKLSNLKQSHNTISWQNGATTRVQEKSEVIQAHVSKRQSDKTFENIEESDSKTSLEAVAPTKVLCEQIEEDSKITEVNAKGASPSICKGNKADVAIEKLKNKKVAKMYEEEIDNRDEIMKNVNDDCRKVKYYEAIRIASVIMLPAPEYQRYESNTTIALKGTKRNDTLKKEYEDMINNWVATQKVLPMEEDFKELSERETGIYIDHFYNDLTEDFNFDEDLQLVMLDSEIEEEWTKVTTQLDSVFYKYTQAQNKSEGTKVTNLLNKIFRIEKDRMTLALRFKKLMNDVKDYHIPSDLLTPEQYTRIRSHLGGKYSIEGLPTLNTQTTINRVASIRHNIDKNVLLVEIQIPLEKEAAANIWEMTTYPVEQKWAKGVSAEIIKCGRFLLEKDNNYQCLKEGELGACYKTYAFICPEGFVDLKPNRTCESRFFENTMKDPTDSCTINLSRGLEETIIEYEVETGFEKIFFFNMPYAKEISLMCGDTTTYHTLNNTGITHTSPKCLMTNDRTIPKATSVESPILPNLNLELSNFREALLLEECAQIFKDNSYGIFRESIIKCPIVKLNHMHLFIIIALLATIKESKSIYGYDCGTQLTNLTVISLIDVGKCKDEQPEVKTNKIRAQLVQTNDYGLVTVKECKIMIKRTVFSCGMHSHISLVANGEIQYYKEVTRDECDALHMSGTYTYQGTKIADIPRNGSKSEPMTFAGWVGPDKSCKGESKYVDAYGIFNDVVVTGWMDIELKDYSAKVNLEANKVQLISGTTCSASRKTCIGGDGSTAFWSSVDNGECGHEKYSVIYDGYVDKVEDIGENNVIYTLETEDYAFALAKKYEEEECGIIMIHTEHPRLIIVENGGINPKLRKTEIAAQNIDQFAYTNAKFLYIEKHLKGQLKEMYYKIMKSKCELERQVLENTLSIATTQPAEVARKIMKENGFTGVVAAEVMHIIKCLRVEVHIRRTNECYEQLPVTHGNESLFLSPRTRILVGNGKQITCEGRLPSMFKIGEQWFRSLPEIIDAPQPEILSPTEMPKWQYITPESLAIGGIYSEKDTRKLRDLIVFPLEKGAVLNKILRGATGQEVKTDGISISPFLSEKVLEEIAANTWNKVWNGFIRFGTASAGILGIVMLFKLIKLLVDTAIHSYALYSLYGFSIHLIGALWDSVTHLLMHLGQQRQHREHRAARNDTNYDPSAPDEQETTEMIKKENNLNIEMEAVRRPAPPIPSRQIYPQLKEQDEEVRNKT